MSLASDMASQQVQVFINPIPPINKSPRIVGCLNKPR